MMQMYRIKKYFWFLFGIIGVVFFWAGIWDGLGNLSYLQNPLISLLAGLFIFALAGLISRDKSVLVEAEKDIVVAMHRIHSHPEKEKFTIKYYDKIKKKNLTVSAKNIDKIEKDSFLVLKEANQEIFIPVHRIKEVLHNNKHWDFKKNG